MDYIVKARGLCKSYGHFKALSDFSINVPKGLFTDLWERTERERLRL